MTGKKREREKSEQYAVRRLKLHRQAKKYVLDTRSNRFRLHYSTQLVEISIERGLWVYQQIIDDLFFNVLSCWVAPTYGSWWSFINLGISRTLLLVVIITDIMASYRQPHHTCDSAFLFAKGQIILPFLFFSFHFFLSLSLAWLVCLKCEKQSIWMDLKKQTNKTKKKKESQNRHASEYKNAHKTSAMNPEWLYKIKKYISKFYNNNIQH